MNFKPGDKAKVIGNKSGHEFEIGETVTIYDYDKNDNTYIAHSEDKNWCEWWLSQDDLEPIPASKADTVGEELYTESEFKKKFYEWANSYADTKAHLTYMELAANWTYLELQRTISQLRAEIEQLKKVK